MGLLKKIGIAVLVYVMLGTAWTFLKIYGFLTISANPSIYAILDAIDFFFRPVQVFLVFFILPYILPPPPVYF